MTMLGLKLVTNLMGNLYKDCRKLILLTEIQKEKVLQNFIQLNK